jgi:hypothetical protein
MKNKEKTNLSEMRVFFCQKKLLTAQKATKLATKNKKASKSKDYEAFCERRRIRTFDRLLRRQVLYPAELCVHFF